MTFTFFEAFSGIGGFRLGIETAIPGAKCIGHSEIEKDANRIYEKNFPNSINYGDITGINPTEIKDFDGFCGGWPCQDISQAGKQEGLSGKKSSKFFDILPIIREKQPRVVFLENVKALLSSKNGWDFATIIIKLDELGYDCEWQGINAANHGLAQNRKRVFIIGHLRTPGGHRPEIFPIRENVKLYSPPGQTGKIREISTCLTSGGNDKWNGTYITHCLTAGGNSGGLHSDMDVVEVGNQYRRFTPIEWERLMGFPDNWTAGVSDTGRYRCLGNAVAVPVIEAIAERLGAVSS